MRLEVFITDLLYEHDCVVVPGFGGLVANYRPARLNHRTHVIHPPAKHIGFNKNLVSNDGLLVHHVSGITGLAYKDALARVEECVAGLQHALMNEGRVAWEKIGVFFRDKAGHLQFIPEEQENFLLNSFGLSPVQLTPVMQQVTETETPVISISEEKKKRSGAWKVAAAIAVPLLVGGALLLRNELNNGGINFASLNPFKTDTVVSPYVERPETPSINNTAQVDSSALYVQQLEPTKIETPVAPPVAPEAAVSTHVEERAKPKPENNSRKHGYAVIGGAFAIKDNAKNFVKKLNSDGFQAEIAGTKDGLTLVAYGIYDTREEAKRAMDNLRSADGVRAWIRKQ